MTITSLKFDNQLVQSFRSGNVDALEMLINRYKDRLYASIRLLVPDNAAAEHIFRNVFITIIDNIRKRQYDEKFTFLTIATRIAYSLCCTYPTDDVLHNKVSKTATAHRGTAGNFRKTAPLQERTYNQGLECGVEQLDSLTVAQREVIALRHYGELSFGEIATLTRSTLPSVLLLMKQGLKSIKRNVAGNALSS